MFPNYNTLSNAFDQPNLYSPALNTSLPSSIPNTLQSHGQQEFSMPTFGSGDFSGFNFDGLNTQTNPSFASVYANPLQEPAIAYNTGYDLPQQAFTAQTVQSRPTYAPTMTIMQHPRKGGVPKKPRHTSSNGDRCEERKPLDPPPAIKIEMNNADPDKDWKKFSPHLFVKVALIKETKDQRNGQHMQEVVPNGLSGNTTYSVWSDPKKHGEMFVLSDLTVRHQGTYRLRIMLYDQFEGDESLELLMLQHVDTEPFEVVAFGKFKPDSPTELTEELSLQGAKVKKARQKSSTKGLKRDYDEISQ